MKKIGSFMIVTGLLTLSACGSNAESADGEEPEVLRISAASTPHGELLEFIAEDLEEEGIQLEVDLSTDGIQTNRQTADGEYDANFFQHTPYLNQVNDDIGLDLVEVAGIHIEPFGYYSKTYDSIDELEEGTEVAIPNDPVNLSRALELLAANNMIELDTTEKTSDFTVEDILTNELNLQFKPLDGPLLPRALDDLDFVAINTNYALETGLEPLKDALIIEGSDSPYVNIVVATPEKAESQSIQKLAEALQSDKVRTYIEDQYEGAVVPVF
ncbi:MetQ/NlpA family ABC transporter substrate-binding protein [Alkalicoccobacillus murimartini]|uniref:Lipoprotein n=1 Tax=Alkalicoccobacillus murimartini TaxID=171685 RepID=A0ABT9YH56_9BACI|nr:MetQ/NlpA family ABC transporter substrate-binding protein [Alkalicoccobacillus murimartini]MDQ0206851.1 D-methionine transport system substrate-binding protein [Alkalicoccobacillus murimartini]